jgi:hypothetical protein
MTNILFLKGRQWYHCLQPHNLHKRPAVRVLSCSSKSNSYTVCLDTEWTSDVVIPCGSQLLSTQLSSTLFIWLKEGHNSTTDPHWYMTFFHSTCGPIKQTFTITFKSNIFTLGQFRKCKRNTWKSFKMWWQRRMEISWAVHVKYAEVLHIYKDGVSYIK